MRCLLGYGNRRMTILNGKGGMRTHIACYSIRAFMPSKLHEARLAHARPEGPMPHRIICYTVHAISICRVHIVELTENREVPCDHMRTRRSRTLMGYIDASGGMHTTAHSAGRIHDELTTLWSFSTGPPFPHCRRSSLWRPRKLKT
jgi:hypothetical protein